MRKSLLNLIIIFNILFFTMTFALSAELGSDFYQDKTKVVAEQIQLLQNRLAQAELELKTIKQNQENLTSFLSLDHVTKQWLSWTKLDMAYAQSNLDTIGIELTESQQTINLLEKDSHEIENQINVYNVIGLKISRNGIPNLTSLRSELIYQKQLLKLEQKRYDYLLKLQKIADAKLQLYSTRYSRIDTLLKSQTMIQLKESQAKYEIDYQQQQSTWLEHLHGLYSDLEALEHSKSKDKKAYLKLQNDIFYANENVNYLYLQMLIIRYQDQIAQLKVSISRSTSISLLNKVNEQTQTLSKQFIRLHNLLVTRVDILEKRKSFYHDVKIKNSTDYAELTDLENQYKKAEITVGKLTQNLTQFRVTLDQSLQQELSARQGLLGFSAKAWLDLGSEMLIVPTLGLQLGKNLTNAVLQSLSSVAKSFWATFVFFEIVWLSVFFLLNRFCKKSISTIPDHEFGHINLKWLSIKILNQVSIDMLIIGNLYWFFLLCKIPPQKYHFLLNICLVWLFFKILFIMARLCLVETVHDRSGQDVRLYNRLRWSFLVGGLITALTVFLHQLPLIYEVKDLFYRLFLLFLSIVSIYLLKYWDVLPGLMLPYIDQDRTYLRKIVMLLGFLIPLMILVNSIIGLFGFINFVLTVSWYQGIFILVLVAYLLIRGFLNEAMGAIARLLIRHVSNGWLWTEAFLKPVDKVLRILLFLTAWFILFFIYRWDRQSLVVEGLYRLLHYQMLEVLNISITPLTIIELIVISSLLYWCARWTREFVYRFLLSRTKDLGIRNSIAILSQYTMILVGALIGLRILGIDLKALTFVASAFALGVGLGLRDIANNFVCGFILLLERPIRVGDTVTLGGHEGDVMHIGGRAVTIRTWDHMEVLVPNTEIFSKTFINWTAKDHIVRTVITLKIHRTDSPHGVQTLIYQTLAQHKQVLSDPAPEVFLKELADELIEFEVRYYVNLRQVRSRISVRSEVLMSIWEAFEKHGIKHPQIQHEVLIKAPLPMLSSPSKDIV